ncbi:hypothetical protein BC830DRAFT_1145730, partial [Chytriomyces sp. MP71]
MRLIAAAVTFAAVVAAQCANPRVRQEWGQMSGGDKAAFVSACAALAKRPDSGQSSDPGSMSWHDFVITHSNNAYWAHGNAQFYPYHRAMMWMFENAIISTGLWPSNKGVPYFDWSAMSQNWWTSDIFSSSNFGAISSNDPDHCVLDGAFSKSGYSVAPDAAGHRGVSSGDTNCLRRNAGQSALPDATSMASRLNARSFLDFTESGPQAYYDETDYHASGHGTLGGAGSDMANPSVSPNDPIFWLHHGLVDKFWWRWQQQCPQFKFDYAGTLSRADDPVSSGTNVAGPYLNVDSWPFQVAQLLDTEGSTLCYTYSSSAGDLKAPSPPSCPPVVPLQVPTSSSTVSGVTATATTSGTVSETATSTSATASPTTGASTKKEDQFLQLAFLSLVRVAVKTKFGGSNVVPVTSASLGGASSDPNQVVATTTDNGVVVFGRDNSTDSAAINSVEDDSASEDGSSDASGYLVNVDASGTQIVSYTDYNHTIPVPGDCSILHVHFSSIGKKKRFFLPIRAYNYVDNVLAPEYNYSAGHPCWLAIYEMPKKEYFTSMNMNYQKAL